MTDEAKARALRKMEKALYAAETPSLEELRALKAAQKALAASETLEDAVGRMEEMNGALRTVQRIGSRLPAEIQKQAEIEGWTTRQIVSVAAARGDKEALALSSRACGSEKDRDHD